MKLHPELLGKHQAFVKDKVGSKSDKPVYLVFHGGSGSSKEEYTKAISYGVVKVNLDTDLWVVAYTLIWVPTDDASDNMPI